MAIVAEAQLSPAPPGAPARLVLDLGQAPPGAAAVARDLATGVLGRIEALLAGPATDLPAPAARRGGRAGRRAGHRPDPGHAAGPGLARSSRRAGPVRNSGAGDVGPDPDVPACWVERLWGRPAVGDDDRGHAVVLRSHGRRPAAGPAAGAP